jgi:hypothetical protein
MNTKGEQGRVCRNEALAGAAKTRDNTMNKWNVLALGSLDTNQSNIISSSQQFAY